MPTQEELRAEYSYDAERGYLLYKHCWVCGTPNARATSKHPEGYQTMFHNGKRYLMHRLIWVYFNGDIPKGFIIDHINHDRDDSRIENLRIVSRWENNTNLPLKKTNKSGHHGIQVKIRKRTGRTVYVAYIGFKGKVLYLGQFDTLDEAVAVRKAKEQEFGFHANHGV